MASGSVSITDERREQFDFPESHYVGGAVLVCKISDLAVTADTQVEKKSFIYSLSENFQRTFIRENRWRLITDGLLVTLEITVLAAVFGTILGFFLCMVLYRKYRVLSTIAKGFCTFIRGTPSLVVLMITYFVVFGKSSMSAVVIGVIAFSFVYSVDVSGTLTAGIKAIDVGQWEAGSALGFSKAGVYFRIIMPQAIRYALPLFKSSLVALLHKTSIVGYITIVDLTKAGDLIRSRTFDAFFPLIAIALIYFAISELIVLIVGRIEIKIDPKKKKERLPKGVVKTNITALPEKTKETKKEELVRIEHLKKKYTDATPLKDVNVSIKRGEVVAVIGPSGTGKSTLLRCINHIESPTEGLVLGLGAKMFTIAGPVLVYGITASVIYGIIYWIFLML